MMKKQTFMFLLVWGITLTTWAQKPNIWILTDMTAATSYDVNGNKATANTDANSDPDDHAALAMYMMKANQFNTVKIVLGSTTRNTNLNPVNFFNTTFRTAYESDIVCLNNSGLGYPAANSFDVAESSLTAGSGFTEFVNSPENKYDNFNNLLPTVQDLVTELGKSKYTKETPLYVLVWGPMTEVAMATKYLVRNNKQTELERLFVVSHWTSSFLNQTGTPCNSFPSDQIQFKPANCNQNCEACAYMHNEAKRNNADFRFVDVGSVGQSGIVNGSGTFFKGGNGGVNGTQYNAFKKSKLGDLFVKSKFGFGKPDGSDCATFYTVLGTFGVKLSDYNDNGVLTQAHETAAKNTYNNRGNDIMQDLMDISNTASADCNVSSCNGTAFPTASISTTKSSCNVDDGVITFTFPDVDGRSAIEFSIDGGLTYPNNIADNTGSVSVSGIAKGTYDVFVRWGNDDCPVDLGIVSIEENCDDNGCGSNAPIASVTSEATSCNSDDGKINFTFPDVDGRTGIEFSTDGGTSYPTNVPDNSGSVIISGVSKGTYHVFVRWGNDDCPVDLGNVTVTENCNDNGCQTGAPTVTVASIQATCNQSNGKINFTFPDTEGRSNIEFSTNGGITYPTNVKDNAGNVTVNGFSTGIYHVFARWGNDDCPVDLGEVSVTDDCDNGNWDPKPGWTDSYQANGLCWCKSNFDHGLDTKTVTINGTAYSVVDICDELEKHPQYRNSQNADPLYNDIQCGNGPANNAADEAGCPGRVDLGASGCQVMGPQWDMSWLVTRPRFGGQSGEGLIIPGTVEAEDFTNQSGVQTEPTSDNGGGQNIGFIHHNDWTEYPLNVTQAGEYTVSFRVASARDGGNIKLQLGGINLAEVDVSTTGGWQNWETVTTTIQLPAGAQTLRFVYTGETGFLFNINKATFSANNTKQAGEASVIDNQLSVYPVPTGNVLTVGGVPSTSEVEIYTTTGKLVMQSDHAENIDVSTLEQGLYIIKSNHMVTQFIKK